ncbi:MAG: cytochrome, partial [Daejeonella sp.]|nr:cytochrome [Daejeonella sp.]
MKWKSWMISFFIVSGVAAICSFALYQSPKKILVFSKTTVYRHSSIEAGKVALMKMGQEHGIQVDTTENSSNFNEENLKQYQAVVFLSTTGDVLNNEQQNHFQRYIEAGGGYLGIHAAADTEYGWPWYGKLVGAWFDNHPMPDNVQKGIWYVADKNNPATSFLPDRWEREDEFYAYKNISPDIHVLLKIDEKTYRGGTNGDNHPMAWYQDFDGGRSFYTAGGHTDASYSEPLFVRHLWEGLNYVIGGESPKALDYSKTVLKKMPEENRFTKVVLDEKLEEPMELTVLPDNRVLFIERRGNIKLFSPATGKTKVIAKIPVSTKYTDAAGKVSEAEDGLLGLTKDPQFAKNNWIYLYYSPEGKEAKNILARYELKGDQLLLDSKKVLLEVGTQREQCCHTGGSITFDGSGNLFLSTGDNSSPRADGFSPIDERPGRSPWDAQKSSGNTNDLRGKILRIHPQADGSYTIPEGNLFPKGENKARPEIYTMGHRDPFRISVDPKTGYLYWGEVGPDAAEPSPTRGPEGHDEFGQAKAAGNFGWPYLVADNKAYNDYSYADNKSDDKFDPNNLINNSPNNTGLSKLPPAQKAFIWYPYAESKEFPLLGSGGRTAMAGPVYHSEDFKNAKRAFPDYYDGKLLIYEWMRGWIMSVTLDKDCNYSSMEPFISSKKYSNPMDMEFGPDGDLYMIEYGTGWFQGNDDARLIRIEYNAGNRKPQILASSDKTAGALPLTVQFNADKTTDPDLDALKYGWKVSGAGQPVKTYEVPNPKITLNKVGIYKAQLTVTDTKGATSSKTFQIKAGNEPPVLS